MTPEQRAALEAELADLQRKHAVRKDEPGFAQNCAAIEARIAVIVAELAQPDALPAPPA